MVQRTKGTICKNKKSIVSYFLQYCKRLQRVFYNKRSCSLISITWIHIHLLIIILHIAVVWVVFCFVCASFGCPRVVGPVKEEEFGAVEASPGEEKMFDGV